MFWDRHVGAGDERDYVSLIRDGVYALIEPTRLPSEGGHGVRVSAIEHGVLPRRHVREHT
jgi:hypothetical protein